LAKLLKAPVLLVVDVTMVTRTAAASVLGCQHLDPEVPIRGVILNRVAGPRHQELLRTTIERYCQIPVVGAIPKLKEDDFPERHMGLVTALEHPEAREAILARIQVVERYLDLEKVLAIANQAPPLSWEPAYPKNRVSKAYRQPVIGVIRDSAFQFYYPENLEALEKRGARLVAINALRDTVLPELDALYIGGGFPETHAAQLAANSQFRESLKSAIESGLPVYAECGGLMYLGRNLEIKGHTYPMVRVLPMDFKLERKPQGHGYTRLEVVGANPFYPPGITLRGHEFHYSRVTHFDLNPQSLVFAVSRGAGILDGKDGVCYRNVLATYTHVHATGAPEWAEGLIRKALAHQREGKSKSERKKRKMDHRTTNTGVGDGVR
jgi:cobyrinic acid a,c-diamide synthase